MKKTAVPSILIAVMMLAVALIAEAQQPAQSPSDRVSNGIARETAPILIAEHSGKVCVNWAISKEKTSCSKSRPGATRTLI